MEDESLGGAIMTSRIERKRKKKRAVWKWILLIFAIVLAAGVAYAAKMYIDLKSTVQNIHEPIDSEKREEDLTFHEQEPFSVLLLGVDERPGDGGRSDTMIVLTVNPETNSTKMLSIPRDTYTEIVGHGTSDKINHAYAYGGAKMAIQSVENLFDIPIDFFVQVNMESFKEIVNAVGGVDVISPLDFDLEGYHFNKGPLTLNGDEALKYVRMRKEDPRGDWGRQDRQRQVVEAVMKKGASVSTLVNYRPIFDAIQNNFKTNMTFDEMVSIQKHYKDAAKQLEQLHLEEGEGQFIGNIWYYMPNEEELNEVIRTLREHLELQ